MMKPDQRLFEADLQSAGYLTGALAGRWGLAEGPVLPDGMAWPNACFWMAAAARTNGPARYYVMIDLSGYRSVPPTGTFWNPVDRVSMARDKFPKGRAGSRVERVFRTDWENGRAFYHPYDRVAASSHPDWRRSMPQLVWTDTHTIVDYLEEFQSLLMSEDYLGQ
jgi:hypothetical protein